ncbi:MAG: AraC family transcriptional regulator [Bifidobacterium dentium]
MPIHVIPSNDTNSPTLHGEVGYSPYYLSTRFKGDRQDHRRGPTRIKDRVREVPAHRHHAQRRLRADSLGFANSSYFISVFRRHTGRTPKQWRSPIAWRLPASKRMITTNPCRNPQQSEHAKEWNSKFQANSLGEVPPTTILSSPKPMRHDGHDQSSNAHD